MQQVLFVVLVLSLALSESFVITTNRRADARGRISPRWGSGLDSGEPLELCEENAILIVDEMRRELGTIFGYDEKSREAGITGEIEFVECDGPGFSVSLSGRFWHATDTVMMRVESYVKNRIPEVMEVTLDMSKSNIQDDNRLNTDGGKRLF